MPDRLKIFILSYPCYRCFVEAKKLPYLFQIAKPISNAQQVQDMIEAILLPLAISVIHYSRHSRALETMLLIVQPRPANVTTFLSIQDTHALSPSKKLHPYTLSPTKECLQNLGLVRHCVPIPSIKLIGTLTKWVIVWRETFLSQVYMPSPSRLHLPAKLVQNTIQRGSHLEPQVFKSGHFFPFQNLQFDFTELATCKKFKYLLVITDQLTGWVEA